MIIGGTQGNVFFVNIQTAEVRKEETGYPDLLGIYVYRDLLVIFEEARPAIIVDKDLKSKYTINETLLTRYSSGYGAYSRGSQVVGSILYFITNSEKQLAVVNLENLDVNLTEDDPGNPRVKPVLQEPKNICAFSIQKKGKKQVIYTICTEGTIYKDQKVLVTNWVDIEDSKTTSLYYCCLSSNIDYLAVAFSPSSSNVGQFSLFTIQGKLLSTISVNSANCTRHMAFMPGLYVPVLMAVRPSTYIDFFYVSNGKDLVMLLESQEINEMQNGYIFGFRVLTESRKQIKLLTYGNRHLKSVTLKLP